MWFLLSLIPKQQPQFGFVFEEVMKISEVERLLLK
jgi:hypothetical protein